MAAAAWAILKDAVKAADRHSLPRLGAALAFYTLFSLAPLLLVVITGASVVFEQDVTREAIRNYVSRVLGPDGTRAVGAAMRNASIALPSGPHAIFSLFFFFFGSTAAFNALLGTLNHIWNVEETHSSMVWRYVRRRLIAFGLVLAVGVFALLSLILSTALSGMRKHFPEVLATLPYVSTLTNLLLWTVLLTLLIATIYRVVPDAPLQWRDVFVGAALTAGLFSLGTMLVGEYIGGAGVGSVFGAAGSLVLLLFWVYYSAQIFLFGAEVTHSYVSYRDRSSGDEIGGDS
jgi:membrane protein